MIVWRVENNKGIGPYQGDHPLPTRLREEHGYHTGHPSPNDDRVGDRVMSYAVQDEFGFLPSTVFGFASLDRLLTWFADELENLDLAGYMVCQFETEVVVASENQLAFNRDDSTLIGKQGCLD